MPVLVVGNDSFVGLLTKRESKKENGGKILPYNQISSKLCKERSLRLSQHLQTSYPLRKNNTSFRWNSQTLCTSSFLTLWNRQWHDRTGTGDHKDDLIETTNNRLHWLESCWRNLQQVGYTEICIWIHLIQGVSAILTWQCGKWVGSGFSYSVRALLKWLMRLGISTGHKPGPGMKNNSIIVEPLMFHMAAVSF